MQRTFCVPILAPGLKYPRPHPPKKLYKILAWFLYPGEDLNPIFKHAELAAWGTGTSFPSKLLCLQLPPSKRQKSRTKWQEPYRDSVGWAII